MTIKYRLDINSLLNELERKGRISKITVNGLRRRSVEAAPSIDAIAKCLDGATYISLDDAMIMQRELTKDNEVHIVIDDRVDKDPITIDALANWVTNIIYPQKVDIEQYGAQFATVPIFSNSSTDT